MIGIIGAMESETKELIKLIKYKKVDIMSGIVFVSGKLSGEDVVCAKCNPGKVNAAICAEAMIIKYNPEIIINSGVAGSLDSELGVYDVAIADSLVQHDYDTSPLGSPIGMIDGVDKIYLECDNAAVKTFEKICRDDNYKIGVIATGDAFVARDGLKTFIKENFNAIACEMEGGSIAHVCHMNNTKFGVLRVISDGASEVDFAVFANKAAKKSIAIMCEFVKQYKEVKKRYNGYVV